MPKKKRVKPISAALKTRKAIERKRKMTLIMPLKKGGN